MVGKSRIVAIGSGGQDIVPETAEPLVLPDEPGVSVAGEPEAPAETPTASRVAWVSPALAVLAVVGWSAFYGWANRNVLLTPIAPAQISALVRDWAVPVLLVGVLWLIAMRTSRRESTRFADAARLLQEDARALESRLVAVNRELSLAREFIAAQSRDLESLGRVAVDRLSQHAERLQMLIRDNGAQVDAIASVSATALENMERLRGQLPVIASSAKDVTNNIGNAGRTAHAQLQEMVNGFNRLNQFGEASKRQVEAVQNQVEQAVVAFRQQADQMDGIAQARFAALAERSAEFRTQLDQHEVDTLAAIRTRAAALTDELEEARRALEGQEAEVLASMRSRLTALRDEGQAIGRSLRDGEARAQEAWSAAIARLDENVQSAIATIEQADSRATEASRTRLARLAEEASQLEVSFTQHSQHFHDALATRRAETEAASEQAIARIEAQLAALDAELARRRAEQEERTRALAALGDEMARTLGAFDGCLGQVAEHGAAAEARLAASLETLAAKLTESRMALAGSDKAISDLTDASVRLLELIHASSQHSREDLALALSSSEQKLEGLETRIFALRDAAGDAGARGQALSDYVLATREDIESTNGTLARLHDAIEQRTGAHRETVDGLLASLEKIDAQSEALAGKAQVELREAIAQLSSAARDAVAGIENMGADAIRTLAEKLGEESGAAIEKVMRARAAETAGQLEQAVAHASGLGREAAIQMRDQLAKVNELAGNLERRVAQARERAEEQVDNDFARRVALITESLNSNAIDIAKALSSDVSDTAWASYLRGDRGVFTRRAVRLLDSAEAKAIAQIYEGDRDFRTHVSHYIHDFEAMLRQLLSTRDGHALGVTLLSSDMGKLYVALAQAIERLRN